MQLIMTWKYQEQNIVRAGVGMLKISLYVFRFFIF